MAWRPSRIVAWVSSFLIVSAAGGAGVGGPGGGGAGAAGFGHDPKRVITSRRASATGAAPPTAITLGSRGTKVREKLATASRGSFPPHSFVPPARPPLGWVGDGNPGSPPEA